MKTHIYIVSPDLFHTYEIMNPISDIDKKFLRNLIWNDLCFKFRETNIKIKYISDDDNGVFPVCVERQDENGNLIEMEDKYAMTIEGHCRPMMAEAVLSCCLK